MSQTVQQDLEFVRVPWEEQMSALSQALRARGREVPEAGYTMTLESVPESERDAQGLPLFRTVLVALPEAEPQ